MAGITAQIIGAILSSSQKAWLTAALSNANSGGEHDVGVLDAGHDLSFTNQPRGFFMQRDTVGAAETVTIPAAHQMIVAAPFTNAGTVTVNGRLVVT